MPAALLFDLPPIIVAAALISNVKPVIDYLRQGESSGSPRGGLLALLVPWTWMWRRVNDSGNRSGRVACTVDGSPRHRLKAIGSSSAMGHLHETPLAAVMEFPPLRQAFGGYCQKALCSEVRWSTVN